MNSCCSRAYSSSMAIDDRAENGDGAADEGVEAKPLVFDEFGLRRKPEAAPDELVRLE